jgi:hypothetical protein
VTPYPTLDFATRGLRMLVPASLAVGVIALYPAIAPTVVARFGPGFEPRFVGLYVATLVSLFLIDTALRDRRLGRLAHTARAAERRADGEAERAHELELMLDLASALEGEARLESALTAALDRLRIDLPFECATVFAPDSTSGALIRRGICPLTALPSAAAELAAREAFAAGAGESPTEHAATRLVVIRLMAQGIAVGTLVLEGIDELSATARTRLRAAGDRIAATIAARRLVAELDAKERALRQAWHELRHSGRRLARSAADAEAAAVAEAAGNAIVEPVRELRREARKLRRALEAGNPDSATLDHLERGLADLETRGDEFLNRSEWLEPCRAVDINDLIVAAIDLVTPELKRSHVEVRMRFDSELGTVETAEGPLYHVVVRLLRRLRAELRRSPLPRRIEISTRAAGTGARLELKANTAGLSGPSRADSKSSKNISDNSLRRSSRSAWQRLLKAARVSIRQERALGLGHVFTLTLPGKKGARLI